MNVIPDQPVISIYLIQYLADPRRHEPRNVGVIVSDSRQVHHQLIDPAGTSHPRRYRDAAETIAQDETYPAWLAYWRRALVRGPDGLEEILAKQRPTFPIIRAGQMIGDVPDDIAALARRYFDELVLPPIAPRPAEPERPVDKVLQRAGVTASPNFHRDYEVPAVGLPMPLQLKFSYAWVNGHVAVADQILHHAGDSRVTASLWKFEHVDDDVRCVAIVDRNIDYRSQPLRDYLRRTAQVIRVDDPDAAEQLRAAFDA